MKTSKSFTKAMSSKGKGSEASFVASSEQQFRIEALRNKLLAIHIAELLGKDALSVPSFISDIMSADLKEPGSEDLISEIERVFENTDFNIGRAEIIDLIKRFERDAASILTSPVPKSRL